MSMDVLKVRDLIEKLQAMPQDAVVSVAVGWAQDTAMADLDGGLKVELRASETDQPEVWIEGWLSNCGTELEIQSPDEDEEDED